MPKQLRSTVQGQYRANSVITTAATRHVQYADAFALPIQDMQPYNMPQMNIPPSPQSVSPPNRPQPQVVYQNPPQSPYEPQPQQNYYHHPQHPSPASQPTPAAPPQVPRSRRITGAWTQEADDVLIEARGNGWPWARIQAEKFPNKSPNACRKRYERLIARKEANEWGAMRDEKMAKEYMTIRKEMWTLLAQRTGDKWDVLEKKCFPTGLERLQSLARSYTSRQRATQEAYNAPNTRSAGSHQRAPSGAYTDDSGIEVSRANAEDEYSVDKGDVTAYTNANEYGYGIVGQPAKLYQSGTLDASAGNVQRMTSSVYWTADAGYRLPSIAV